LVKFETHRHVSGDRYATDVPDALHELGIGTRFAMTIVKEGFLNF